MCVCTCYVCVHVLCVCARAMCVCTFVQAPERKQLQEEAWHAKMKRLVPCVSPEPDQILGEALAKQTGNVTECALIGFLVELGVCVM